MLIKIKFYLDKAFYQKKNLLEKAVPLQKLIYSLFGSELRKKTMLQKNSIKD